VSYLDQYIDRQVVSNYHYGGNMDGVRLGLSVPVGSIGIITGSYDGATGRGFFIEWLAACCLEKPEGTVGNAGLSQDMREEMQGWYLSWMGSDFVTYHCAQCESPAGDDDYLCGPCRVNA
jgi:hypothetical protein